MVEVLHTDEFEAWYLGLSDDDADSVAVVVERLVQMGVTLPFPHSSDIKGCRYPIRELRPKSGHSPLRVFYAFDPRREAVLLIGGDKSGDDRFYETFTPKAEHIWEQYLRELQDAQ